MAAYKAKVKTVIIPYENKPDLEEVDNIVKENVRFIPVKNIEAVLDNALVKTNTAAFEADTVKTPKKTHLPKERERKGIRAK